jgi:flavin reductase (DIM6/NTAB) family NADH-FMN oxidoreductase RutF
MSSYPTGVTVVAGRGESGEPYGLTVNSFTSVSLDPPLVLVCIAHTSTSHDRLVDASHFAVNVLSADQAEIAMRFAQEPSEGRFDGWAWRESRAGVPILEGTTAWLECRPEGVVDGGDHTILVGRVVDAWVGEQPALLFHRGRLSSTAS